MLSVGQRFCEIIKSFLERRFSLDAFWQGSCVLEKAALLGCCLPNLSPSYATPLNTHG